MHYILNGFLLEISLLITVGMQNTLIIKQSIKREHAIITVLTLAIVESSLLIAGTAGVGAIVKKFPNALEVVTYVGISFLIFYATKLIYTAFKESKVLDIDSNNEKKLTILSVVTLAVAFGYLNPHLIIDITFIGSLAAANYPYQWEFCLGAVLAVFLWYSFVAVTSSFFASKLNKPKVWKVINIAIAILCLFIAFKFYNEMKSGGHSHENHLFHIDFGTDH